MRIFNHWNNFVVSSFSALFIFVAMPMSVVASDSTLVEKLNLLFARFDSATTPGAAVGVFRNGRLCLNKEYGMADISHRIPISDTTVFYIGSMAKQFTAYTVFQLVREGKIDLDQKISSVFSKPGEVYRGVTVRHLLYHTSGIRDFISLGYYAGVRRGLDYLSQDEIERMIFSQKGLNFNPGERFSYSNSNYWLLAKIVEIVTGQSFAQVVRDNLFIRFNMRHSLFTVDMNKIVLNRAVGYSVVGDSIWSRSFPPYSTYGAGGMFTNIADLASWDQVFYELPGDDFNILDSMLTPYKLNDGKLTDEGSGIITSIYRGKRVQHHSGNSIGFGCQMLRFPDDTLTVAVLFNTERRWADPSEYAYRVADIVLFGDSELQLVALPANSNTSEYDLRSTNPIWHGLYLLEDGTTVTIESAPNHTGIIVDDGRFIKGEMIGDSALQIESRKWRIRLPHKASRVTSDTLDFIIDGNNEIEIYPLFRALPVTESELSNFTGRYYSEEIGADWIVEYLQDQLRIACDRFGGKRLIAERLYRYNRTSFTDGSLGYYTFIRNDGDCIVALKFDEPRLRGIRLEKSDH